jgi:hypothetical protein
MAPKRIKKERERYKATNRGRQNPGIEREREREAMASD